MFEIEKNIPMTRSARFKYPFPEMEAGDSFGFPGDKLETVSAAASTYRRRHGRKFSVRKMPDGSGRCWRVA